MKRTPTFQTAFRHFLLCIFTTTAHFVFAQGSVAITITTTLTGDENEELIADFFVSNFEDIVTMQYTINWDPSKMEFDSVLNFNLPGLDEDWFGTNPVLLADGKLTHSWINPPAVGLTLPSCTRIFSVKFKLTGAEPSLVTIGNSPTPIEVMHFTTFTDVGLTQSTECAGQLLISGIVNTWWAVPMDNTALHLSGDFNTNTNQEGQYLLSGVPPGDYTLSASKENSTPRQDVSVLDLLKVRKHLLNVQPFTQFEAWSSDVNLNSAVTTLDLVLMTQLILSELPEANLNWRFIAGDYALPNVLNSFDVSSVHHLDSLNQSLDFLDFTGYQPGNPAPEILAQTTPTHIKFRLTQSESTDSTLKVEVTAADFTNIDGFQFGLKWDENVMTFQELVAEQANPFYETWVSTPSPGSLNLLWMFQEMTGLTLPENAVLFTLVFQPLAAPGASTSLLADDSFTPKQVIADNCKIANVSIETGEILLETPNAVHQNQPESLALHLAPNPSAAGQERRLAVFSEHQQTLHLQLMEMSGALIWERSHPVSAGSMSILLPDKLAKGMFLLKVTGDNGESLALKVLVF